MSDKTSESILQDMNNVEMQIFMLLEPRIYLLKKGATQETIKLCEDMIYSALIEFASKITGVSKYQLDDDDTRTQDQKNVIQNIFNKIKLSEYYNSGYYIMYSKLTEYAKEKCCIDCKFNTDKLKHAIICIIRYFFAIHAEINTLKSDDIKEMHILEVYDIFDKALSIKEKKPNKTYLEAVGEVIGITIPVGEDGLGEIIKKGFAENLQESANENESAYLIISTLLPMVQGAATNRFRATATKNIVIDLNGNAMIEEKGFKAFFKDYTKLKGGLSIGAKKMLDAGALALTAQNHFRAKQGQNINTAVSIALEEYGRLRGYDISPRQTSTPEEEEKEKKRINDVMHNIRKQVNDELAILYSLSLSWTEPGKKQADYKDVRILQSKGIRNGYINMRFSQDITAYLTHAYIMQYPTALQAIDERNPRAYNVGWKLAFHHSMDNNRAKGTANIISVTSLLDACGDMPSFEDIQASKNRGHWERLIKDPLEKALDATQRSGVIVSWEYCNSKKIPLDDGQVAISDYPTFIELYVHFEMMEEPDQSERLQRKAERIEASKNKRPRKKTSSAKE